MSTVLYMMIGFVPDEHIREWTQGVSWVVEAPTMSFIAGVAAWLVLQDLGRQEKCVLLAASRKL